MLFVLAVWTRADLFLCLIDGMRRGVNEHDRSEKEEDGKLLKRTHLEIERMISHLCTPCPFLHSFLHHE